MSIISKDKSWKGNRFWQVVTAPTIEPVTLAEIKEWARIDGVSQDTTITALITSCRQLMEEYLNRALLYQKIELIMDEWIARDVELPMSPLISVDAVVTIDEDDTETTYSSSYYFVITDSEPGRIVIKNEYSFPENTDRYSGGYKIKYYAGYGTTASDVPQVLRDALKMWVAFVYDNRVLNPNPPKMVKELIKPYRIINI